MLIIGMFVFSGINDLETTDNSKIDVIKEINIYGAANDSAMTNLSGTITTLLTDIIPIFVVLGIFGAIIKYVRKMSDDM